MIFSSSSADAALTGSIALALATAATAVSESEPASGVGRDSGVSFGSVIDRFLAWVPVASFAALAAMGAFAITAGAPLAAHNHGSKSAPMAQKTIVEGGLSLCLYCAWLVDQQNTAIEVNDRGEARLLKGVAGDGSGWLMIDDLVDYRATVLVWSALGGGSTPPNG